MEVVGEVHRSRGESFAVGWDTVNEEGSEYGSEVEVDEDYDFGVVGTEDDIYENSGAPAVEIQEQEDTHSVASEQVVQRLDSKVGVYGLTPLQEDEDDIADGDGGLVYYAVIYRDGYKNKKICNKAGELKPRRAIPQLYEDEFFNSLTKTKEGSWMFHGRLNGWPSLVNMEVLSLEYVYSKKSKNLSKRIWRKTATGKTEPTYPKPGFGFFKRKPVSIRAKLRAPEWSLKGYSKASPGHVYWYAPFRNGGARVAHGIRILNAIRTDAKNNKEQIPKATKAHFFGHRYAKIKEGVKDRITYHTGVFIEWDHGKYGSIFELAYLFGIGGYAGKANWLPDLDQPRTQLYEVMPDCMKGPWIDNRNEIRVYDVPMRNVKELMEFMKEHEGRTKRFLKPNIKHSGDVKISSNAMDDIFQFVINYQLRDASYSEQYHHCQSFAADFWNFLCGKKSASPYAPLNLLHKNHMDWFPYGDTNQTN